MSIERRQQTNMDTSWHIFRLLFLALPLFAVSQVTGEVDDCDLGVAPEELFLEARLQTNDDPYGYVAHALGSIDGQIYTNSQEAFERNYAAGFRLFEVDLVQLKDGTVLAAHDRFEKRYGLQRPFAETTKDELAGNRYLDTYTPMTGRELLSQLNDKKNAYLIADTKSGRHFEIVERLVTIAKAEFPCVLDRVIPHIAGRESELARLKQIHPFKNYMLALYRSNKTDDEVLAFMKKNHLNAVMMWWDSRYTPQFKDRLRDIGVVTYVHSIKDPTTIAAFRRQGVGVYTDSPFPHR